MSQEESRVKSKCSGTLNQGPWRFSKIFRAVSSNHLLHISSPNAIPRSTIVPTVILAIEYPRHLWDIQEIDNAPGMALTARDQPNEINQCLVVATGPNTNEFGWTVAGDLSTEHVKKINHGAFGEVHMVGNIV